MAKKSKAIVKSSTVLTGSVSKARKELVLRGLTALSKGSEEKLSKPKIITLRSSYKTLSVSEVQSMANVSIREKPYWGFRGHGTINHDYNLKAVSGDVVVVDSATGLMWYQSGSYDEMFWDEANEWVEDLNSEGYAGYNDWRLPTVDEAVSLLESSTINGDLYIDPVFSKNQRWIWTGDMFEDEDEDGSEAAWSVDFGYGGVYGILVNSYRYVRPVRSVMRLGDLVI